MQQAGRVPACYLHGWDCNDAPIRIMMDEAGNAAINETARLEAALERIARSRMPDTVAVVAAGTLSDPAAAALAKRLDALIVELRAILGRDSGD